MVAMVASVFNGVSLSMIHGNAFNWILIIGYSSGDMDGQIVLLLLLIALMKINRKLSNVI